MSYVIVSVKMISIVMYIVDLKLLFPVFKLNRKSTERQKIERLIHTRGWRGERGREGRRESEGEKRNWM